MRGFWSSRTEWLSKSKKTATTATCSVCSAAMSVLDAIWVNGLEAANLAKTSNMSWTIGVLTYLYLGSRDLSAAWEDEMEISTPSVAAASRLSFEDLLFVRSFPAASRLWFAV